MCNERIAELPSWGVEKTQCLKYLGHTVGAVWHATDRKRERRKPLPSPLCGRTPPVFLSLCEVSGALSHIRCGPSSQGAEGLV